MFQAKGDNVKVDAWIENPEGKTVAKGSLSIGEPAEPNYVRSLALENAPRDQVRILERLNVGDACPSSDEAVIDSGDGDGEYMGLLIYPASMYGLLNVG